MSEPIASLIVADLAPAFDAIAVAAGNLATQRAKDVSRVSGGAVETTPDQLAAIQAQASDELFEQLREQLRDVANVFVINITQGK